MSNKEKYIELMELALKAYTDEHIDRYFNEVQEKGLSEHGFARLTANIGILIAHGRRLDLTDRFLKMMEFCCANFKYGKAANDFTIREIICCIIELERKKTVAKENIDRWKDYLAKLDNTVCYNIWAKEPTDKVNNWALFSGVSEFFRQEMGLCKSEEFIDTQIASQLKWFDENGMYMDAEGPRYNPIQYDLVARGLFALLLNHGYNGQYYDVMDDILKRAGLLTLKMQSPNGEMAFGGRSNQFIHNEPWVMLAYEYEAKRYAKEGNFELAKKFKSAIKRAMDITDYWLNLQPIYHIKNRFPTETKFGCEGYAYFDKYMITTASFLYSAYLICDENIPTEETLDVEPDTFETSTCFHKCFLKAGGYGLEFDFYADAHYDASGLGRIHKVGAPSTICMSHPCPARADFITDVKNDGGLSLCAGVLCDGEWKFATSIENEYTVKSLTKDQKSAYVTINSSFSDGKSITSKYTVNADGVLIKVIGEGDIAFMLPAFCFDGEVYTEIQSEENNLSITYHGYTCKYTTNGKICDMQKVFANRNGHYKGYYVSAKDSIDIKIEIFKA